MAFGKVLSFFLVAIVTLWAAPAVVFAEGEIIEFSCPSCDFRERFVQGFNEVERARNVQHIIVVCERNGQIRNVKIALNPDLPVKHEPLVALPAGKGRSELLGMTLPRFLVPGNTCPLFPITAYLERNVCPVDGRPGIEFTVVGRY
jgi:hypothetical protein